MEEETKATAMMMASLATLSLPHLSDLTNSIFSTTHHNHLRLTSLLSSPPLFSLTLNRLHSLSLPHKTLLIARHLLSSLRHLTHNFQPASTAFSPSAAAAAISRRDLDAVLLLLFLCEVRQHSPEALRSPPSEWRRVLCKLYSGNMLRVSGGGGIGTAALVPFIETVTRCLRFVGLMGGCGGGGRGGGGDVPASVPAVVALPSVEVSGGGCFECAICKDEMGEGRDVCELPCQHLFHWMCILPWLRKKNTCPCCRFQLPTDDVFGEIQRLWEVLVFIGGKSLC